MKNWKVIVLVAGAALVGVAAFLAFGLKSGGEAEEKDVVTEGKRLAELRKKKQKRSRKNRDGKADGVKVEKTKPSFAIDDDDESHLNEEQRKTIEAIRDALADNDKPRVLKLVQKMQSSDEWPDGSVKGLRAQGGYTVDIAWRQGKVVDLKVSGGDPNGYALMREGE